MTDLIGRIHTVENFDRQEFERTDTNLQPAYTWVWNAPIKRNEIRAQLDAMLQAGIRTVYILPEPKNFRTYNERIHMLPDYLTDEFFRELRYAVEYALEIGMGCWMYDEGGWPSGSACGQVIGERPDLCRKMLSVRCIQAGAEGVYRPGEHAVAAFMRNEDGKRVMIAPGERIAGGAEIEEYYARWMGGITVDSLDEDIGREFVAGTHEKYSKHLGDLFGKKSADGKWIAGSNRIPMMFTDEPGAGRYPWPRHFEQRFKAKFGYDIAPFAPDILNDGEDADRAGTQARIDYRELAGEMFRDNYFVPIHEWCRRNNVLSTGHLDIDHQSDGCMYHGYGSVLSQLREMDVPGVDVIWGQIALPNEERVPCAEGNGFFPRFAASAAVQSGGKLAVSESFAVYGAGLTGEEMRFVINHQLVRGINLFNFMSMSYGKEGAVPTVMRPAFLKEMPGYYHLRAVNDYTARGSYLMQLGESGVRAALYIPNRDMWTAGSRRERAVQAFDAMGRAMEAEQIEFDIIDDEAIRLAEIVDGELRIGRARYRCVLVPDCEFMPEDVREIVSKLKGKAEASVKCNCRDIRVRTRIMPDGSRLWMLFNESWKAQVIDVEFPCDGNVYLLDAENADVEKAEAVMKGLKIGAGEAKFYLSSAELFENVKKPAAGRRVLTEIVGFELRRARNSWIDEAGIHERSHDDAGTPCKLGDWSGLLGSEYSGEAVYSARMKLAQPLIPGKRYELDLGLVECSAKVTIEGKPAGIAWAHPKRIEFDGAMAAGKSEILLEIEVANTLSNQFVSQPLEEMYPAEDLGPYQERLKALEKDAPRGGLYGPVMLYELIVE